MAAKVVVNGTKFHPYDAAKYVLDLATNKQPISIQPTKKEKKSWLRTKPQ